MKFLTTSALVLFCTATFAQKNTINPNQFSSPFKSKADTTETTVVKPKNQTLKRSVGKPTLKKQGDAFFIEPKIGSSSHLRKSASNTDIAIDYLKNQFNLNEDYTFEKINDKADDLGFSHSSYKQFYRGVLLNESLILVHSKNGEVKSINGHVANNVEVNISPSITEAEALLKAKTELNATNLLNEYPTELVITKYKDAYQLAYKVRIDATNPMRMFNVFVDANNGNITNKISLMVHADEEGTADTYYSGSQTITTDNFGGGYRLRDNGRKIETYDATNATEGTTEIFDNYSDYVNNDNTWEGIPYISTFTISNTNQSWWYSLFVDTEADFYLVLRDGNNTIVYTTPYKSNTSTPVSFELNQFLSNPPYSIEIWDYDNANSDDFGGSYSISTLNGTQNWSGNGNNGSYQIGAIGHPALDVHWGMEQSFDFYLNILGRNSFDNNGTAIKNFVNPKIMETIPKSGYPNQASALGSPYNIMLYGMGDQTSMRPLVGLDVEGHEFTHLVVDNNGNGGLIYEGESGALNESFADIMGTSIEFYSGVDPDWFLGEGIMINEPFMRSLSNPKDAGQPHTYEKEHWVNTFDLENDHGGVHTNSGVQNYWFYLLSEGGSGTNDLGNSYSVTSIGMTDAVKIAYRNLITYLTPNATYYDAYLGSLQAAEDLFGNPSTQYTAVREAWYAVGIGNDPYNFCSGTTELTEATGTFSDGSGSAEYGVNANCKWVIAPPGATRISLNFTAFDTEDEFDTVFVYDGPDETHPILMTWYGNTLPPTINTTDGAGAMCVVFKSDESITSQGWSATYTSQGVTPTCSGGTNLTTPTGSLDDGSSIGDYTNNQLCYWMIAPPCAESVTLNFTSFDTELDYDGLVILDGFGDDANIVEVLSGTSLPSSVTSNTGEMLILFYSDYATVGDGFEATYTSTGSAYCNGVSTLNSTDYGYIDDGSGANNYCNNLDCQWLIQPPQATSITLEFTEFDLEEASTDGNTIFDAVEVYDGTDTTATLLGQFTGSSIPKSITSSGGSMLVRFHTDMGENHQGWSAFYSSTSPIYCSETNVLTTQTGTITDGSATDSYANNTYCSWLIQPSNAETITLSFQEFDTEQDYDGVVIYDGADNSASVLGEFTGTTIPSPVTSSSGSMYVEFLSDPALRSGGFTATYNAVVTGINEINISDYLKIYPNPNNGNFYIDNLKNQSVNIQLIDIQGKEVFSKKNLVNGSTQLNLENLPKGVYTIRVQTNDEVSTTKIVIN